MSRPLLSLTLSLFFTVFTLPTFAHPSPLSLNLQNASLPETLRSIAQFLHLNVMISPSVQGWATLSLYHARPRDALNVLLASNDLAVWKIGQVWWIAPREEVMQRKQAAVKWQAIVDESAALATHGWRINYAKAEDIVLLLQDQRASFVSKRGHVRADARTNTVFAEDSPWRLQRMNQLIAQMDVPVPQIAIEARIVSVDSDFERELGLNFGVQAAQEGLSANSQGRSYSVAIAKLADGTLLDVKLAALENAGHAELISRPSLFAANQQAASIEAGEEVPYQEVSDSGGTATVFKKAVLGLKVTPQLLPGNKVLLQLQISQDRPNSKTVLGMPTISTRQITTSVLVAHGKTIVLGGIYETMAEKAEQRLPFVSGLPLLGLLFKQQKRQEEKRELLIFVTPKVII